MVGLNLWRCGLYLLNVFDRDPDERTVVLLHDVVLQMMPVLLRRLAELDTIVEQPRLACKLTELLQAVLEWDQLKVWRRLLSLDRFLLGWCMVFATLFCCK